MKRLVVLLFLLTLAQPSWAVKKITVGQLEDLLHSLQQAKKTDAEIANELKQVELSEELTRGTMNNILSAASGPLCTAQIYVLEARSADLAPPAADLPAAPAPDPGAQREIFAKAEAYVNGIYDRLPALTATRVILRFQDNEEAVDDSSGVVGGAKTQIASSGPSDTSLFFRYINSTATTFSLDHGVETPPSRPDKTPWGANGRIAIEGPAPSLGTVFREARSSESLKWLRWELVNSRQVAVFSFAVPTKTGALALDVCCFPNLIQAGVARFYNSSTASVIAGREAAPGGGGGVVGNFQTSTTWHDFKVEVPYHGELFIDPGTGAVVRMITVAELKPSEVVHRVDTRIDYGPVKVGGKVLVLPVKSIVNTEVVPSGDSGASKYSTRHTLLISEFKGYD